MNFDLGGIDPERFEELCKELLSLDGFTNVQLHGPGQDDGLDLLATKDIPIAHGNVHRLEWLVQCKHLSPSRSLGVTEISKVLARFETQSRLDALLIVTSTKLSGPALNQLARFREERRRVVLVWDITDIEGSILRHPFLVDRFALGARPEVLPGASEVRALLLSDGSVFAYHLHDALTQAGFRLSESRVHHFGSNALSLRSSELAARFDLVIVLLAELYWEGLDKRLLADLGAAINGEGLRAIFLPFCAWSVHTMRNQELEALLPVRATLGRVDVLRLIYADPKEVRPDASLSLIEYRDVFIENQEIGVKAGGSHIFSAPWEFKGRTTYEFLALADGARCIVADDYGTPFLAAGMKGKGATAYFNMSAHNCMTPFPLRSPLEQHRQLRRMVTEFTLWFATRFDGSP